MSLPSELLTRAIGKAEGVDMAALAQLARELDFLHGEVTARPRPALVTVIDIGPLAVAQSSLVLDGVPQNYRHLWLVASLRSTQAIAAETVILRVNGDTGANYDTQSLTGNASTASALESIATASPVVGSCPGANAVASDWGFIEAVCLDYANAAKKKTWRSRAGYRTANATGGVTVQDRTVAHRTATALARVDLVLLTGQFEVGSRATLYALT